MAQYTVPKKQNLRGLALAAASFYISCWRWKMELISEQICLQLIDKLFKGRTMSMLAPRLCAVYLFYLSVGWITYAPRVLINASLCDI